MMIRRLGAIAEDSKAAREFVLLLLRHQSAGGPITRNTWRSAQRLWEDTVEPFIHGHRLGRREAERQAAAFLRVAIRLDERFEQRGEDPP